MQKMQRQCGNTRKNMDEIISAYSAISVYFRIKESALRKNAENAEAMRKHKEEYG